MVAILVSLPWIRAGAMLMCLLAAGCAALTPAPERRQPTATDAAPRAAASATDDDRPASRSVVLPVLEIVAMNTLVNLGGRLGIDRASYAVTPASIRRNLRSTWVVENDPFEVNQILHPHQGAMYHGIARSTGHGYWSAAAYTFAGSALWEIAGETTPPSLNDQVASGIAGSFLGEPLFRVSRLLLDRNGSPGGWRILGATLIAPPAGLNRAMFGDRFDRRQPDVPAAADVRVQLGVSADTAGRTPAISTLKPAAQVAFSIDYGVPGNPDYRHTRPFDYFRIDGLVSSGGRASLTSRGLLAGKDFGAGSGRGVWGLYGTYEYFAPDVFTLSSTSLSFGATTQAWLSSSVALQGTALVGGGYAATHAFDRDKDDYDYGVAPQAAIAMRLAAGRRAAVDVAGYYYAIGDISRSGSRQRDRVFVGDASIALRVHGPHGIAVRHVLFQRDVRPANPPRLVQRRSTIGLFYTFLGARGFGASR